MLRIKINGHALELSDDTQINLIIENPMLSTDRIPLPYTLLFSLPPTPGNLDRLGNPDRVTSNRAYGKFPNTDMSFGPIAFLTGTLMVLGFDKNIKVQFVGVILPDTLNKTLNAVELQHYDMGASLPPEQLISRPNTIQNNYRSFIFDTLSGDGDFVAAPVKVKDAQWPGITDDQAPTIQGAAASVVQYFNFFNTETQDYTISTTTTEAYPMPFIHKLFEKLFSSTLMNNPFAEGELQKMVLFTSSRQERDYFRTGQKIYYDSLVFDSDLSKWFLQLETCMPKVLSIDLIKDLLKLICATMFTEKGKLKVVFNKEIINGNTVENWSSKLINKLATSPVEAKSYSYGYPDYPDQEINVSDFNGAQVKESMFKLQQDVVAAVKSDTGLDFYIPTTRTVIHKTPRMDSAATYIGRYRYDVVKTCFGYSEGEGGIFDVKPSVLSTLPMTLGYRWHTAQETPFIKRSEWYVPEWDGDRNVREEKAYVLLFQGMASSGVALDIYKDYPFVSSHNIDYWGNSLGGMTLHWLGADGLLARYHDEFKTWIEKTKVKASGVFRFNALDLKNLDLTNKKHVNGRLFFIEKISVTLKKFTIEPAVVDLIEAPYGIEPFQAERSESFKKICAYNEVGSSFTYTKTYISKLSQEHANYLAEIDPAFKIEGQAQANAQGTCTLGIRVTASIERGSIFQGYEWKLRVFLSQPAADEFAVFLSWKDHLRTELTAFVVVPPGSTFAKLDLKIGNRSSGPYDVKILGTSIASSGGYPLIW